jgi:hypothetical protein
MKRDTHGRTPDVAGQVRFLLGMTAVALCAILASRPNPISQFDWPLVVGLAVAFFATRLLTIRLPQGDDVYVTLVVGLAALAVADIAVVLVASAAACVVEWVARFSSSSRAAALSRALDAARATALLGLMAPWQLVLQPLTRAATPSDVLILWVVIAGITYSGLDILTMAIQQRVAGGPSVAQGVATLQRPLVTMYLVHIAMAAVAIRLYAESGAWAFPIALLLSLILQNSFNLYLRIRRGYADTIRALAQAAELDRPHDSGHARRVADLSVSVGRRIGLSSRNLERIGYAALLHDIGRMGNVPDDFEHAERGAQIVSSIPFLADVAPLISPVESLEGVEAPVEREIVRVCSHYDRLRAELGAEGALDRLSEESGGLHGRVLEALAVTIRSGHRRMGSAQ